jgi:hypothetical protein
LKRRKPLGAEDISKNRMDWTSTLGQMICDSRNRDNKDDYEEQVEKPTVRSRKNHVRDALG